MIRAKQGLVVIATLSLILSACGGGGGGGGSSAVIPTAAPTGTTSAAVQTQNDSVAATEGAGAAVDDVSSAEGSSVDPTLSGQAAIAGQAQPMGSASPSASPSGSPNPITSSSPNPSASPSSSPRPSPSATPTPIPFGTCVAGLASGAGVEYFKPDKAGDPNSYEYQVFYDSACTKIARDHVHVINSTTGTTTKTQVSTETDKHYSQTDSTNPTSVSVEVNTLTGQVSTSGYPILSAGYSRASTYTLTVGGTVETKRGSEHISLPKTPTSQSYCGDSAGYSGEQHEGNDVTFGYQNLLTSASRTVNADGSVTYSVNGGGSVYSATPPATFTLNQGTLNTTCPIATPAFTLSGGTLKHSYGGGTFTVTFFHGVIQSLSIVNETLSNGYVLNASSNPGASPTSSTFITGTITKNGTTVATFNVDAFGNGTLTVTATGATYTMEHWHVTHGHTATPSPSPSTTPSTRPTGSPVPTPTPTQVPSPTHT